MSCRLRCCLCDVRARPCQVWQGPFAQDFLPCHTMSFGLASTEWSNSYWGNICLATCTAYVSVSISSVKNYVVKFIHHCLTPHIPKLDLQGYLQMEHCPNIWNLHEMPDRKLSSRKVEFSNCKSLNLDHRIIYSRDTHVRRRAWLVQTMRKGKNLYANATRLLLLIKIYIVRSYDTNL
jgi:hypothetical protein